MKIATFNANSIRSRLDIVTGWLTKNRPDILCIQETKVVDELFPEAAFMDAGYHVAFHGEKSYNGIAIASLVKPDSVSFGLDDGRQADPTRLACARFGKLSIVNTYVPQGRSIDHPMYAYKLEWLVRLKAYFARHFNPDDDLVWTGDMNVAPDPMDIHNAQEQEEHVCFHMDVRKAFASVISWGFTDVFRMHNPGPGHYTFFDYRTINALKRNMGWRVDHIMATRPLAARCKSSSIDLEPRNQPKPSDHTFLSADFTGNIK